MTEHPDKMEIAQYCIDNEISIMINIGIDFDKRRIYPALGLKEREDGVGLVGMHCQFIGGGNIGDAGWPFLEVGLVKDMPDAIPS